LGKLLEEARDSGKGSPSSAEEVGQYASNACGDWPGTRTVTPSYRLSALASK
jgi:hypothetical protein